MSLKESFNIKEGIKIHKIDTNKYKTNLMAIYLTNKINRENLTKNALILSILRRGTNNLKTQEEINIKLEELYGAEFSCGIDKIGNDIVFKFYIEILNDEFTYGKEKIFEKGLQTIFEIIFNPLIEENKFNEEYFENEKENLRQLIRSRKDNKGNYAYIRCVEEMYKDDPYGLFLYGYEEDLDKISNEDLYKTYLKIIAESKIDIFLSGDIEKIDLNNSIEQELIRYNLNDRKIEQYFIKNEYKEKVEEKIIKENMDVTQGKLVIGLDILNLKEEEKKVATVYNAILGGGANSKLFQNVREKASLAYTAGSIFIKTKNNIFIKSGIELENYEKAIQIIRKQIEDMKKGLFNEIDIENAKKIIIASYRAMEDEQDSEIAYLFGKEIEQDISNIDDYIKSIQLVKKEEIIKIANNIEINTIYFLSK